MLHLLLPRAVEGSMLQNRITDPSNQPFPLLAPTHSYTAGRVCPSHTLSLLLCLCLSNGFPNPCLLIPALVLWHLARTPSASQSHGPCSSGWFSFLSPLVSSTISQRLSDYIIFIPSSTLLPPKLYGVFYTLLCLFVYFSYFIVQDSLRSSASSVSYLSLSQWLQFPSLVPEDVHPTDPNPRCSSLLDLSFTHFCFAASVYSSIQHYSHKNNPSHPQLPLDYN